MTPIKYNDTSGKIHQLMSNYFRDFIKVIFALAPQQN